MDNELLKLISRELSEASKTLRDYEKKIIDGSVNPEQLNFFMDRVKFWSDSVLTLRNQLSELRSK